MATPPSELKVITSAKNLNSYLFKALDNAPKKFRGTIIARLKELPKGRSASELV